MTTEQKLREALQTRFKLIDSSAPGVVKDTWTDTNWQIYGARNFVAKANSAIPPSQATSVESEYVRVPREPTRAMLAAGKEAHGMGHTVGHALNVYKAMLAALEDGETP